MFLAINGLVILDVVVDEAELVVLEGEALDPLPHPHHLVQHLPAKTDNLEKDFFFGGGGGLGISVSVILFYCFIL